MYRRSRWTVMFILRRMIAKYRWLHFGLKPKYLIIGNDINDMLNEAVNFQNRINRSQDEKSVSLDPYKVYGLRVAVLNEVIDSNEMRLCR